jgi:hypothetical protein
MSDLITTRNINDIEKRFKYIDIRNNINKEVFNNRNSLHYVLPQLDT